MEQAAAPDADLANVKQVTAMDAADAGRAEHVLLTKLSSAPKETASESDRSACMALHQWAVVLSRAPQTMPTAAAHPALFANLAAAARTAHTPELRQVAKGLMTDGFVAGPGDLGQRVTREVPFARGQHRGEDTIDPSRLTGASGQRSQRGVQARAQHDLDGNGSLHVPVTR